MKFLHCMSKLDYLLSALQQGLMLTDHEVRFAPSEDRNELASLIDQVLPLLRVRLANFGMPLESLPQDRVTAVFSGIGNMSGQVPMLCLSEVPRGKIIDSHRYLFGSFALVIKPEWLARNGADRVIYVGHNSTASQQIFICLATMRIFGLFVSDKGKLIFDNESIRPALSLLTFFETRDHLQETEWRIAGQTGFMGGVRETGKKLPLGLSDVEYIFVPNTEAISQVQQVVDALSKNGNSATKPNVMIFPKTIPE